MNTENLYWVLSPDAYADLRQRLIQQAEQERREALQHFGAAGLRRLMARIPQPSRQHAAVLPQKA